MTDDPVKPLSDGKALDAMTTDAEAWARKYRPAAGGEEAWGRDFDARLGRRADELAAASTAPARRFRARDWVLAVLLWLVIGMAVFVFSVAVMQLSGTWTIIFGVFAILVAAVGLWQSWAETTSAARAEKRLAKKRRWLADVSRKSAFDIIRARQGEPGSGAGTAARA